MESVPVKSMKESPEAQDGTAAFHSGVVYQITLPDGLVIKNRAGWKFARLHVCEVCGYACGHQPCQAAAQDV